MRLKTVKNRQKKARKNENLKIYKKNNKKIIVQHVQKYKEI